jgi:hypothetical protein
MDDQRIRQIVQDELRRNQQSSQYQLRDIAFHTHDGINSQKIKAENVIPATSVMGNVEFAQIQTYRLNLNASFTPQRIDVNGSIVGTYSSIPLRGSFSGVAVLTPTFYFQPSSDAAVVTGNLQYPYNGQPAQNSTSLVVFRQDLDFGGSIGTLRPPVFATSSEFHICSVNFPTTADVRARLTVTRFSREFIEIDVPFLDSGWSLFANFTIS